MSEHSEISRLQEALAAAEAERDAAQFAARNGRSLSEDSIHAIRELLRAHDVPSAAFIDDHVANAIHQRDIAVEDRIKAEAKLTAAEARMAAKDQALTEAAARLHYSGDHFNDIGVSLRAEADWAASELCRAALTSDPLPALLETRKKALEEAAKKADAFAVEPDPDEVDPYDDYEMGGRSTARSVAAAIRSLAEEVRK